MLTNSELIAFLGATDSDRAKIFYRDKLGLNLITEESSFALVFQSENMMLRVSLVENVNPAQYTVLGWKGTSIDKTVGNLASEGITFERFPGFNQDEQGVWTAADGTKVAWFKDPDGNILSITEFAT